MYFTMYTIYISHTFGRGHGTALRVYNNEGTRTQLLGDDFVSFFTGSYDDADYVVINQISNRNIKLVIQLFIL